MKIINKIKKFLRDGNDDKSLKIIRLDEVDSTNNYLRNYQPDEDEVMTVVVAENQTAGRGQGTNRWESEPGKNLTFSILVHPLFQPVRHQFQLSEVGALAIKEALGKYVKPEKVTLKWPNDVYYEDRKISGTLIETSVSGGRIKDCVFGVGLNVNQTEFRSDAPNPVSLCQILGHEVDRDELLKNILHSFREFYKWLERGDDIDIASYYHDSLYHRHGFHRFTDAEGEFEASIVEVEDDGHLILRDRDGIVRSYAFKEVKQ